VVEDKTASLIATAGRFGAMFAGAPADVVDRICSASHALGVAFQLSDDILDVASESVESGKEAGTDLREGVRSLPVLHALAASPGDGGDRLRELLSRDGLTDEALHAEALALLRAHPAMDAARADLAGWVAVAQAEIAGLPDVPARHAFKTISDFVLDRTS
jgi:heptaprenyl diphosphate synthase